MAMRPGRARSAPEGEVDGPDVVLAGAASLSFSTPPGTVMSGFIARASPSAGVHDALSVRALVLERKYGVLVVDACALHERTCLLIEARALELGLERVVVSATHTHSGPSVAFGRLGPHDGDVHDGIVDGAHAALELALRRSEPCSGSWVEEFGLGVSFDRRRGVPIDVPARALRFCDSQERVKAVFVSFACHPVVLDATNRLISGDYPAFVRDAVERRYPDAVCIFAAGAAGEVNTGHSASDSLRPKGGPARSYQRAAEVGERVANAVIGKGTRLPMGRVTLRSGPVVLPYAKSFLDSSVELPVPPWEGRVSVLDIGSFTAIFLPGEVGS